MGIELKTTSGNITLTTPKSTGGGDIDLSNYYTKAQTDEQISNAINAIEIPEVDLTGYATEEYVDERVADDTESTLKIVADTYVTKEDWETIIPTFLTEIPEEYLTESEAEETYARITDIPDVSEFITEIPSEYVTETELEAKGYATTAQIPDVSQFVTATYVQTAINENAPDLSAYQTEAQVNTLISNALAEIGVAEEGAY